MYRIPYALPIEGIKKLGVVLGNEGPNDTEGNPKAIIDIDTGRVEMEYRDILFDPNNPTYAALNADGSPQGGVSPIRTAVAFTLTLEEKRAIANICMTAAMRDGVLRAPDANHIVETVNEQMTPPPVVPAVVVTVTPPTANIAPGGTVQLAYTIENVPEGGSAAVVWGMRPGDLGTVDQTGLYTAPPTPGTYYVGAASVQDNTKIGFCIVTVA